MSEVSIMTYLISLLENVGFPVMVTLFLLIRYEVRIKQLEDHSKNLSDLIKDLRRDMT
ncbi:YvrJ family protein [Oceanobacillus sp. 1P07AA]|uniref:YvrJ family protein n=1 Tax=Oceanobacillus sp. 1P07AA TaxID=3132293 RepID=UPI0039A55BD8